MPSARSPKDKRKSELKSSPYFSRSEASSRYFCSRSKRPCGSPFDLDAETSSDNGEAYEMLCNSYLAAAEQAVRSKPLLIQDEIAHDIWKVLVASMLLNVTTAKQAIPVFRVLMEQWPSPSSMAQASKIDLIQMLRPLGLYNTRAERLITMSKQYIENPPSQSRLWESRVKGYVPTAVSHLVGCGRYALDSFRIFCCGGDEWKSVMPWDKELIKYLKWKWAVEANRKWDPIHGAAGPCDEAYFWSFTGSSQYKK